MLRTYARDAKQGNTGSQVDACISAPTQEQDELAVTGKSDEMCGKRDASGPPANGGGEDRAGANSILQKMAVRTGLSFFFFMLERDSEAKGFLLQSSASFLSDLQALSLHRGLGKLEAESLSKVTFFFER